MPPLTITLLHTPDDCRTPYFPTFIPWTPSFQPPHPTNFFFFFWPPTFSLFLLQTIFVKDSISIIMSCKHSICKLYLFSLQLCCSKCILENGHHDDSFMLWIVSKEKMWSCVFYPCQIFLFSMYLVADLVIIQLNQSCKHEVKFSLALRTNTPLQTFLLIMPGLCCWTPADVGSILDSCSGLKK